MLFRQAFHPRLRKVVTDGLQKKQDLKVDPRQVRVTYAL
jgi:hypothetical protein